MDDASGRLARFADRVWIADGPRVRFCGLSLPTRMIVVALRDGSLWINSPVAGEAAMDEVECLGPVGHLVAPTSLHAWRLSTWRARFPNAVCWELPVRRTGLAQPGSSALRDEAPRAWGEDIDQVVVRGNALLNEVWFLHRPSRTAIACDFIQNFRSTPVTRLAGVARGGVPRDVRWTFTDRRAGQASLAGILAWDFDALIVAHGTCIPQGAHELVRDRFAWLMRGAA